MSQSESVLYDYGEGIDSIDWDTMKKAGTTEEYSISVFLEKAK